jgi:phage terminase small subunit
MDTEKQSKAALNPKQQRFVEEYLVDLNATQAAIRAGYSKKTAHVQACNLLKNPKVQAAVQAGRSKQTARTEINADWLLKRLAEEADADIADIYAENGGLKPVHSWPLIWRKGLVAGLESKQEFDYVDGEKIPDGVVQKVKMADRVRRLELIGKHIAVGAFVDKHEHTGKDGAPLMPDKPVSDDELARRMLLMLEKGARAVKAA